MGAEACPMTDTAINEWFTVPLEVTIRLCREDDLAGMEWFGLMTEYREIFQQTFRLQQQGDVLMLVADVNGFPAGQVWINLTLKKEERIGALWAVRVFPFLQDQGIGARLMSAAERILTVRGYVAAELGVEKDNPNARRFYERLGYREVGTAQGGYSYTTPEGREIYMPLDEWIMLKDLTAEN